MLSDLKLWRIPQAALCGLLVVPVLARPAQAHVKWFAPYDMEKPPLPIGEVLTGQFVSLFLASVLVIYAFFWLDRYAARHQILDQRLRRFTISEPTAFSIMRVAAFLFFLAASTYSFAGQGFLLTPELKSGARWLPFIQVAIALCALHRATVPLIGVGMLGLYATAISRFGAFHLLDYLIVLGAAYYFLASRMVSAGWTMSRYLVLYAATGLTLLWASIEKWGYPGWTFPLLEREPELLCGFAPPTYMMLAGFVEFVLTFMVLSSASMLSRTVTLGLVSVFVLAIAKFGMIDAVGHSLIIAILSVLILRGPTKGRDFLMLEAKSLWTEAYFMTGLYVLAFVVVFIAYYGLHYFAYGN